MNRAFDTAAAARLVYQLVQPFTKTEAFKLGIIDAKGNKLKRPATHKELQAYTKMHVVVFNLKKLIANIPGGSSKLASYAAAAWLLKEHADELDIDNTTEYFAEALELFGEEAAANAAGGGNVAGIGVGPDGEPGVVKKKKKKYKDANQLDNTNLLSRTPPKV